MVAACIGCAFAWLETHGTPSQWLERAQRVPLPALHGREAHRPTAPAEPMTAQVLERVELPGDVVALASHGNALYAGTFDRGAFRIENGNLVALPIDSRVNDLAVADDGTVYAATNGGAFADAHRLSSGAFTAVTIWKGRAAFASAHGISIVEGTDFHTLGLAQGIRGERPSSLADCGVLLCIGASDGVWLFDGSSSTHRQAPEEMVTAVARDGGAGFAGDGRGPQAGASNADVWAGTLAGGVARLPGPAPALPDNRVSPHALFVHGGEVFIGTPSGLVILRGELLKLVRELAPVTAIAPASGGGLWVGTRNAAVRVDLSERLVMR
jgi:ligand-binding sensor domain-containing protein